MAFVPSTQQSGFYEFVEDGAGSAILEAVAGAGKTTTLINGLRRMSGSVFFGAYNKKIADEIKRKVEENGLARKGLFVATMHGAGFGAFRRQFPQVKVDERKVYTLLEQLAHGEADANYTILEAYIAKMVSYGKSMLVGVSPKRPIDALDTWTQISDHFGADADLSEGTEVVDAIRYVQKAFRASANACDKVIDFDDMIWAPLAYRTRFFQNDWVLVDECQDLNPARLELARRMLRPGGRLIAVGDSHQAIYGFTGAFSDAMDQIATVFDCTRLPLTVTYRCPKAVVSYVHQWVSHIEAHPDAPEGEVREAVSYDPARHGDKRLPWFRVEPVAKDDAILCRYVKPLVRTAYAMLRDGIACRVEGRDIGRGLIALAKRWKVRTLDALETKLEAFEAREVEKFRAAKKETAAQAVKDRVDTLRVFIERCRDKGEQSVACVVQEITDLFADDVKGVTVLSTGHKSKGREWDTVFWLQAPESRYAVQDWQKVQEDNLKYVIGTRAKQRLILVNEASWNQG